MSSILWYVRGRTWSMAAGAILLVGISGGLSGCAQEDATSDSSSDSCALNDDTTATSTVSSLGCAILERDVSSCQADREAQGLSGFWLKFSCRVTLTKSGNNVVIAADGQPDYKSKYFETTNSCYEAQDLEGRIDNPNVIGAQNLSMTVPLNPTTSGGTSTGEGTVGIALNGVSIFDNTANAPDDIYEEALTFDKCDGHSENMQHKYHYHTEPVSITQDDDSFIGVLRDGNPVYGKYCNGVLSTSLSLDDAGGHSSTTIDSPTTSVYHYHVNQQTSGNADTLGQKAWFITNGKYKGAMGTCDGC